MSVVQFEQDAIEVEKVFDTLSLIKAEGQLFIRGELPVIDKDGKLWHNYDIEIHYTKSYPAFFPIVYETGNVIPRIADWHINTNGSCCLDNEFSQQIKCFKGLSLLSFIRDELLPWLANQSYRRVTGNYINGEQGHGDLGYIEFFMIELKASNLFSCIKWMHRLATREMFPRQAMCFCGSGIKWRQCHKPIFERLQPISIESLVRVIDRFLTLLKADPLILKDLQRHTNLTLV